MTTGMTLTVESEEMKMNESKYYHSALECALLNGVSVKENVRTRIDAQPQHHERTIRLPKRLIIALVAAALLMIGSVAVASSMLRNQAFKENTDAELKDEIETVTQPLNPETQSGWQPNQLILFDNVMQTKEDVVCRVKDGFVQLAQIGYVGSEGVVAELFYVTERENPCRITDLSVSINKEPKIVAYQTNQLIYAEDHYCGETFFRVDRNPIWPGAEFIFTGKMNDEPFTLHYTFTEQAYRTLQRGIVDALQEHLQIVEKIPDQGTQIGYQVKNEILAEVAVKEHCLYYTILRDPNPQRYPRGLIYDQYDKGIWPVIDGRTGEFYYLGNVDAKNPEGEVYSTYLPYTEERLPRESLISFMGIMFRYEWETGKATVPQDEAEYEAWRKESMELSAQYNKTDWIWQFDEKLGNVRVTDLVFQTHSMWSTIGIMFESEQKFSNEVEPPRVWINGIELVHVGEIDPLSSTAPYVRADKKKLAYCMVGYSPADLTDTFTLTVEWQGNRTEIALKLSDVIREAANTIDEYQALFRY